MVLVHVLQVKSKETSHKLGRTFTPVTLHCCTSGDLFLPSFLLSMYSNSNAPTIEICDCRLRNGQKCVCPSGSTGQLDDACACTVKKGGRKRRHSFVVHTHTTAYIGRIRVMPQCTMMNERYKIYETWSSSWKARGWVFLELRIA